MAFHYLSESEIRNRAETEEDVPLAQAEDQVLADFELACWPVWSQSTLEASAARGKKMHLTIKYVENLAHLYTTQTSSKIAS